MNSDLVEFYYKTKHASSISSREKEELENKQDEKIANNFRQIASTFAKNHPKAVESAITGGVLGAGSELVMPANKDMMGNPSTNLGEMAKRGLLGAALGAAGGEIKTQVRNHVLPKIAQEDIEKVAGKFDKLKQFGSNHAGAGVGILGGGATGGILGADPYNYDEYGPVSFRTSKEMLAGGLKGALIGAGIGGLAGHIGADRPYLKSLAKTPPLNKIEKTPITLPKNRGKLLSLPVGKKSKSNPIPKTDKSPKGTVIKFPEPEKTAGALDLLKNIPNSVRNNVAARGVAEAGKQLAPSSLLQTAGKYMAKSPTLGGAAIGAGAGLAGNFLSGEDHALGSALAGAGAGALGGKALLKGNVSKTNPLFGQSFGTGVRNELKAGLKAKPVVSTPITSPSLQNAPSLGSLINDAKGAKPLTAPVMPKRPESIEW